jgi:hypothetical protein
VKRSDKIALGMGGLTMAAGIVSAVFCPLAGLGIGAYLTYGAVAGTMGTGATVALTAAGGVGGLFLGRLAAPLVAWGSIGLGVLVGAASKGIGSLFDKNSRNTAGPRPGGLAPEGVKARGWRFSVKITDTFNKNRTPANGNRQQAPAVKKAKGLEM